MLPQIDIDIQLFNIYIISSSQKCEEDTATMFILQMRKHLWKMACSVIQTDLRFRSRKTFSRVWIE